MIEVLIYLTFPRALRLKDFVCRKIVSIYIFMVNNTIRIVSVTFMILSGAFDTLIFKTQNSQVVEQGGARRMFFHPYMQVATVFLAQAFALLVYFVYKHVDKKLFLEKEERAIKEGKSVKFNKFLLAIPAFCGSVVSTLQLVSLNFINSSVYQIVRGGTIVTTFLFSILILRKKIERYQVIGGILAFIGVAVVGVSAVLFSDSPPASSKSPVLGAQIGLQIAGYIMLVVSLFIDGFSSVFEQTLFKKYHIQPLQMVGIEGSFGVLFMAIIVAIASYIPCTFSVEACAISSSGDYFLQSPPQYLKSVGADTLLLVFVILEMFSILTYNTSATSVTKFISALARNICDVTRTVLVWSVGIIVTVTVGESNPIYKWESTNTGRTVVQLVGFLVLISGNLLYNNLVKFGCLQRNDRESSELLTEGQSQQASPGKQVD